MTRWVYAFEDGGREQRDLLGGKGANLAEMTRMGLPVPPGFTITTAACRAYLAGGTLPPGLRDELAAAMRVLERRMGRRFGEPTDPLLVSVRSGAAFSMPGMMDTVLNLGLNDRTVRGLASATGDERMAWDAYRRFVQMFGKVVLGVPADTFERRLAAVVAERGLPDDTRLGAGDLRALVADFKSDVAGATGREFPEEPGEQLARAVVAVFESWNGRRARDYRRIEGIPDDLGTAVNVQAMVFGNAGDDSGSGVAFTRDPATGEPVPYGDWLPNAQGEDVVAGIRVTRSLDQLAAAFPECHAQLLGLLTRLERHYRDLCDVEFTIERGRLFMLQTRVGKRTAQAAVRIATDLVADGLLEPAEALTRVTAAQVEQLLHPQFAPDAAYEVLCTGLNASPGAAVGRACFTADDAQARADAGEAVILVRQETSPEDLHGMVAAQGILTARGGVVSHAAVVARGLGKPAVCGAEAIRVDVDGRRFTVDGHTVLEGELVALNGTTGEIVVGAVPLVAAEAAPELDELLGWADQVRRLGVRANADTAADAAAARERGAAGIGLCRTEHMFLGERLPVVQRMILARGEDEERAALAELGAVQRADFVALLEAMDGLPVTVRLLDPPLHEFLPDVEELVVGEARGTLDDRGRELLAAARVWREANPMLGTRGCRLGILKPQLYRMQTRALVEAAVQVKRAGAQPQVEVMIPLTALATELRLLAGWVRDTVAEVCAESGEDLDVRVGTMIETPRAALTAAELAADAEFFSFGTNDLTQMVFGFSRDDVEARLLPEYLQRELLEANPFHSLDRDGVGRLLRLAVDEGRAANPALVTGLCGEHGGDPTSILLCHDLGLGYVSCSPYRLPVARLAAAHAALGVVPREAGT